MARGKTSLPLIGAPREALATPTVDAVRRRLGGRASTGAGAGAVVAVGATGGVRAVGVVLFTASEEIDVWVEEGVVRRCRPEEVTPFAGTVGEDLVAVSADARVFGALQEGERVRYLGGGGGPEVGLLVEKCRFGALVLRDDGRVLGVGFRRLWPEPEANAN